MIFQIGPIITDSAVVPSDQTDYKILFGITSTSGITNVDITAFFTTMAFSDRKKVIFWNTNKTVQLNAEFLAWDQASQKAWYMVEQPTLNSALNDSIWFQYNPEWEDNTAHIGDVGSIVGQNIWSGYLGLWHYQQDPSGSAPQILDSTGGGNDGTSFGSMLVGDLVDSLFGKGLDFTSGKGVNFGESPFDISGNKVTIEAIIKPRTLSGFDVILQKECSFIGYDLYLTSGKLHCRINTSNGTAAATSSVNVSTTSFTYVAAIYDGSNIKIYENGVEKKSVSQTGNITLNDFPLSSGTVTGTPSCDGRSFNGIISEVRLSEIARSADYVAVNGKNFFDTLLTFPSSGIIIVDDWTGEVGLESGLWTKKEVSSGDWNKPTTPSGDWTKKE